MAARLGHWGGRAGLDRRGLLVLAGLVVLGVAVRLLFVVLTTGHELQGDEPVYDEMGRLAVDGHWFWSSIPSGEPHPSLWKAPGYVAWVSLWYTVLGESPDRVFAVQSLVGGVTIVLVYLLGRRVGSPAVGLLAAGIYALHPFAWQFETRMYSEVLSVPLAVALLLVVLDRPPTRARVVAAGVLLGLGVLVRPSAVFLFAAVLVAWVASSGVRRGVGPSAAALLVAALCVAPWTIRNYVVDDAFVPVSVQDAALYGTFNDDAANDRELPWVWRAYTTRDRDVIARARAGELSDSELRAVLQDRAREYILDHPSSVPKAIWWNGVRRTFDLRSMDEALGEARVDGRSVATARIGLVAYWVLLPLAVVGLVLLRRRPALVLPVVAAAAVLMVLHMSDGATRYRSPLEPVIAAFAAFTVVEAGRRLAGRRPDRTAVAS